MSIRITYIAIFQDIYGPHHKLFAYYCHNYNLFASLIYYKLPVIEIESQFSTHSKERENLHN